MDDGDLLLAGQLAENAQIGAQVAERHAQSTLARKASQDSQNEARVLRARIALKYQPVADAGN